MSELKSSHAIVGTNIAAAKKILDKMSNNLLNAGERILDGDVEGYKKFMTSFNVMMVDALHMKEAAEIALNSGESIDG